MLPVCAVGLIPCPWQVARDPGMGFNGVIVQSKFGGAEAPGMRIRRKTSLQFAASQRKGHRLLYAENEDISCSR